MPADIIAPDRDRRARLDWLALGDWHGHVAVSGRTAYCGSPERTSFGHDGRGICLVVWIDGPGAVPHVKKVDTGIYDWRTLQLDLVAGDDAAAMVAEGLPDGARREMLVRVVASGRVPLGDVAALTALEDEIGPDFCHFELDMSGLGTEISSADLDAISPGGALRAACDALAAEAADETLAARDRKLAEAALRRLGALVAEEGR